MVYQKTTSYLLPYDSKRPIVCFDERSCFLIGNSVESIKMKKGSPAKENYSYTKHGSCSLLAMIEPKTKKRIVHVRRRRRKVEFAKFMKGIQPLF